MNPLSGLIAPILALLPAAAVTPDAPGVSEPYSSLESGLESGLLPEAAIGPATGADLDDFAAMARSLRESEAARQVRIEQRVIIRISPGAPPPRDPRDLRRNFFADLPSRGPFTRLAERKMNQCVSAGAIAGVKPDGPSRLMLFMRDQRIVSASLEKSCNARDFYSGFLVERSTDGQICAGRDRLLSRSGSNCALGKFRQMVAVEDDDE